MAVDLLVDIADIIAEPVSGSVSIRPAGGVTLYRDDGQIIAAVNATETLGTGGGPTKALFPGVPTSNDPALRADSRGYALEVTAHLKRARRRQGNVTPTTLRWIVLVEGSGTVELSALSQAEGLPPMWASIAEMKASLDAAVADAEAAQADAAQSAADAQLALQAQFLTQDEGVATLISNNAAGPQTQAALAATVDARAQAELFVDWTTKADGVPPATLDSGHAVQYDKNSHAGAAFVIDGGTLRSTAATAGVAASYVNVNAGSPVHRLGGEFILHPGDNYGGSADLIVWQQGPGELGPFPSVVPDSPFHLEVHPERWVLSVFQGGAISSLKTVYFPAPLARDGSTVHRVEAYIVGASAYIYLPDGSFEVVTDARIEAEAGPWACWESYQSDPLTDARAAWLTGWADTRVDYRSPQQTLAAVQRNIKPVSSTNVETGVDSWARAGKSNTASATGSAVVFGTNNLAQHTYSSASGYRAKSRGRGSRAHAAGVHAVDGDAQSVDWILYGTTTDATPTLLGTDGTTGLAGGIPVAGANVLSCTALVAARRTDQANDAAAYRIDFAVYRVGGSAMLLGTPVVTVIGETDALWNVEVAVDAATNTWRVRVTGATGKTIRWTASVRAAEVCS